MVGVPGSLLLWSIKVFVAMVEEGSVSDAAQRFSTSISSVSRQVTNLEAHC
ncbi:MAG: LysR family transcriptional regulator [Rhodobacteraceae bacterium]|nr:LysR family transcriptional regulator [Paracoccaceae bacterium]